MTLLKVHPPGLAEPKRVMRNPPPRKYPLNEISVGGYLFCPDSQPRSVSAHICRISKKVEGTFTTGGRWGRKVGETWELLDAEEPGAVWGTAIWRTE